MDITIVGIDLAKSVFQLHGVDAVGNVVLEKRVRRGAFLGVLEKLPPCLIGMEGVVKATAPVGIDAACGVGQGACHVHESQLTRSDIFTRRRR